MSASFIRRPASATVCLVCVRITNLRLRWRNVNSSSRSKRSRKETRRKSSSLSGTRRLGYSSSSVLWPGRVQKQVCYSRWPRRRDDVLFCLVELSYSVWFSSWTAPSPNTACASDFCRIWCRLKNDTVYYCSLFMYLLQRCLTHSMTRSRHSTAVLLQPVLKRRYFRKIVSRSCSIEWCCTLVLAPYWQLLVNY